MSSRISEKQVMRELKRISEGIPEELLKNLMRKQTIAPTIKELIEKAIQLGDDQITPEKRQRFQNIIDSGVLDKEVEVINKDGEAAISAYYDAEIALAIKLGRLPKVAEMPAFIRKKGLKYARKQQARLKELYDAGENGEEDAQSESGGDTGANSAGGDNDEVLQRRSEQGDGREASGATPDARGQTESRD